MTLDYHSQLETCCVTVSIVWVAVVAVVAVGGDWLVW